MGCDCHCYVEHRPKERDPGNTAQERWDSFGARINPGRNYLMFAVMAGVRAPDEPENYCLFKPRGFPTDPAWYSNDDNYLYVKDEETNEEGCCTREDAEKWVNSGHYGCHYKKDVQGVNRWVSHPDWHTHSWLTLAEFKQVFVKYLEFEAVEWEEDDKKRQKIYEDMKKESEVDLSQTYLAKPWPHNVAPEYQAMIAAMEKLEELGSETRLVFWFDN